MLADVPEDQAKKSGVVSGKVGCGLAEIKSLMPLVCLNELCLRNKQLTLCGLLAR